MLAAGGLALSPQMVVNGDADATLRRFLRARKYKLEAAYAMLHSARARMRSARMRLLARPQHGASGAVGRSCLAHARSPLRATEPAPTLPITPPLPRPQRAWSGALPRARTPR